MPSPDRSRTFLTVASPRFAMNLNAASDCCSGSVERELPNLRLAVEGKLTDSLTVCICNIGCLFDGVAKGKPARQNPNGKTKVEFTPACHVEARAH